MARSAPSARGTGVARARQNSTACPWRGPPSPSVERGRRACDRSGPATAGVKLPWVAMRLPKTHPFGPVAVLDPAGLAREGGKAEVDEIAAQRLVDARDRPGRQLPGVHAARRLHLHQRVDGAMGQSDDQPRAPSGSSSTAISPLTPARPPAPWTGPHVPAPPPCLRRQLKPLERHRGVPERPRPRRRQHGRCGRAPPPPVCDGPRRCGQETRPSARSTLGGVSGIRGSTAWGAGGTWAPSCHEGRVKEVSTPPPTGRRVIGHAQAAGARRTAFRPPPAGRSGCPPSRPMISRLIARPSPAPGAPLAVSSRANFSKIRLRWRAECRLPLSAKIHLDRPGPHAHLDPQFRRLRVAVFLRVGDEVDEDLRQAVGVGPQRTRSAARSRRIAMRPPSSNARRRHRSRGPARRPAPPRRVERHHPVFQHAEVQQVVQKPRQPQAFVMDDPAEPVRAASSTGSACIRISENDRIEVIGVRNSWLIWLRKASFCTTARSASGSPPAAARRSGTAPPISPPAGWNTP
jgi:hypothetical protein